MTTPPLPPKAGGVPGGSLGPLLEPLPLPPVPKATPSSPMSTGPPPTEGKPELLMGGRGRPGGLTPPLLVRKTSNVACRRRYRAPVELRAVRARPRVPVSPDSSALSSGGPDLGLELEQALATTAKAARPSARY
jgi:hypothetical protein